MKNDKQSLLKNFYIKKGRLPSYSEMMKLFGYRSKGGVARFVEKMINEGVIGRDKGKLYALSLKPEIKILGTIRAGFPGIGEEVFNHSLSLDEWMIKDPDASYMLEVEGDSMMNAGIHKGDYVVVEMTKDFKAGMIVIAEIDGEWTMKYLRIKNNKQYLEAANEKYPNLYPQEELILHAKVVGVVRKYE